MVCGRAVQSEGLLEPILAGQPRGVDVSVYAEIDPEPCDLTVTKAGDVAALTGADLVIGIGGGSSMDAAKAVAVEACDRGWIERQGAPGRPTQIRKSALPIIAVPTTAGTGSEVTPFCAVTFTATQRKRVLEHDSLQPRVAILDPLLLTSAPRDVRVAAGMDALARAVESHVSKGATDRTRELALESVRLIGRNLRRVAKDGRDLDAQAAMQVAATLAGLASRESRLGIVHAMVLPLSALFRVRHGIANAILLPHGMAFNSAAAVREYATIARALGEGSGCDDDAPGGAKAVEAVVRLAADIGAPKRLSEVGVRHQAVERMADDAMRSPHISVNPRPVHRRDIVALYVEAL